MKSEQLHTFKNIKNKIIDNDLISLDELFESYPHFFLQGLRTAGELGKIEVIDKFFIPLYLDLTNPNRDILKEVGHHLYTSALISGNLDMIKFLDKNSVLSKLEPIKYSAACNHIELAKYFISQENKDQNERQEILSSSLISAAAMNYKEMVIFLHEQGAQIYNGKENNAMSAAILAGHLDIVKYFIEQGYPLSAFDNQAIRKATQENEIEILQYLVVHCNANIDVVIELSKNSNAIDSSIFNWATQYKKSNHLKEHLETNLTNIKMSLPRKKI